MVASGRSIRRWTRPLDASNPASSSAIGKIVDGFWQARKAIRIPVYPYPAAREALAEPCAAVTSKTPASPVKAPPSAVKPMIRRPTV